MINKVSIILCTYNAEKYIKNTLKSISEQEYPLLEILLLDNNSSDNTVKIIKNLSKIDKRIKLFKLDKNIGAYEGLNYLIRKSKGEYIAINDHDDIWHPKKISMQMEILNNHPEYAGCGTDSIRYFEKNKTYNITKFNQLSKLTNHTSLIFKKGEYQYDLSVRYKTDQYFMKEILCMNHKLIYNIPLPLVIHRIRGDVNNLNKKWLNYTSLISYLKRKIDLQILIFGIIRLICPNRILLLQERQKEKDINYLKNKKLTKVYFIRKLLP